MAEEKKLGLGLLLTPKEPPPDTEGDEKLPLMPGDGGDETNEAADMAASAAFSAVKEDDEVAFKDALRQYVLALKP